MNAYLVLGVIAIVIAGLVGIGASVMEVSVGGIVNVGLIESRRVYLMFSQTFMIVGALFYGVGIIVKALTHSGVAQERKQTPQTPTPVKHKLVEYIPEYCTGCGSKKIVTLAPDKRYLCEKCGREYELVEKMHRD